MKKNKYVLILLILILLVIIFAFFQISSYIKDKKSTIDYYNDYSRASIIFSLSYYKEFDDFYNNIRYQQRYNNEKKETISSLIYDIKKYNVIDVLKFLDNENDNDILQKGISKISDFIGYFNYTYNNTAEEILFKNKNGIYYVEKGNEYSYIVKKKVISINTFSKLFKNYLMENENNISNYFYQRLWNNEYVSSYYIGSSKTYEQMIMDIENNYSKFYELFKNNILNEVANILDEFGDYLIENVNEESGRIDKKLDLETTEIEITYKFSAVQRIYNDISEYSTQLYKLDLKDIWIQLEKLKLPKIYM